MTSDPLAISAELSGDDSAGPSGGDAAVRREALDPRASFIVRAPAGSGKTTLLTQRLLRLLADAEAPEEIVAITFTRKAAAEMRERLLGALRAGLADQPPPDDPRDDKGTWALARQALTAGASEANVPDAKIPCGRIVLGHPNRLRIQTIDAFCHGLARQHPWRSGIGGGLRTLEDAAPLYRDAARTALRALEEGTADGAAVAHLLRHRDVRVDAVEALLVQMLARRDQWLRHLPEEGGGLRALRTELEATLAAIVADALAAVRREAEVAAQGIVGDADAADSFGDGLARLARHAMTHSERWSPIFAPLASRSTLPGVGPEATGEWIALRHLLLTSAGEWRKPAGINATLGFPIGKPGTPEATMKEEIKLLLAALASHDGLHDGLREALAQVERLPAPVYTDGQWATLEALVTVLRRSVACLREGIAQSGTADFVELSRAAERVAGDGHGDFGIRHLLVDEFQDSSHGQFRLLERLTAAWQPGDGRTLFLVGDPMQSIYRFREADVGLFQEAQRGIAGVSLKALRLERNFRSVADLVAANNRTFAAIFPATPDALRGAVTYAPAAAVRTAAAPDAVQVHALIVRDGSGTDDDQDGESAGHAAAGSDPSGAAAEAARVADIARAALASGDQGSVAILVQARSHLTAILPALADAGVPIQAVALDPLDHRPGVQDVLSLTRALLYPADRIAWLSVLRAPWCGAGLGDLEHLAAQDGTLWEALGHPEALAGLTASGRVRVGRVRAALEGPRAEAGRFPLRETVERAWLALGGPACVAEADRDDVRAAFAVIEAIEADGALPSPEELSRRLARIRSVPAPGSAPAVQVMTIHEAKGLEFDTVILPGLHRRTQGDTRPLLRWMELRGAHPAGLVLAPIPESGSDAEPIHRYLDDVEQDRARNEKQRLLYVACTRARERLHLVGVARADADGVKPPHAGTLLAALWPTVAERFEAAAAAVAPRAARDSRAAARAADHSPTGLRLAADWTFPALPPDLPAQPAPGAGSVLAAAEAAESPIVYDWAGSEARIVGKVVHGVLQRIALQGPDSWSESGARERVRLLLRQEGLSGDEAQRASGRVVTAIARCLADSRGRWVLGAQRDARVEWELTLREGPRTRGIVLDRTFVDAAGVRWIVDYKTGSHAGGGLDAFLDEEQRRYRPQLERYALALRLQDAALPIRCGLYFPLVQDAQGACGWREWAFADGQT